MPPNNRNDWDEENSMRGLEQKAADWLILHDRGLNARQREEFSAWLEADERHAEIYAEMEETWMRLGELHDNVPSRTLAGAELVSPTRNRPRWLWPATLAAAAAAVMAIGYTAWQP